MKHIILYSFKISRILLLVISFYSNTLAQRKLLTKQLALRHDNDVFRLKHITDRYYSFGLLVNYTTAVKPSHFLVKSFKRVGFQINNKIVFDNLLYVKGYTPDYKENETPGNHRPFAGISNWEPSVYISNSKRIWRFGAVLGVRGKISGAEWIQEKYHNFIGDSVFAGWQYQLPNKVLFGLTTGYVKPWRIAPWIETFSETELSLGNYRIHLIENIGFRIGLFNDMDKSSLFMNFLDQNSSSKNEYYIAAKFFGKTIVTDATLEENWNSQEFSVPFDKKNSQIGYQIALFIQVERFGIQAAHIKNSTESNFSGKHSYGSLSVLYSFH